MKLKRLADPQVSPDGAGSLYGHRDRPGGPTRNADLWLVPLAGGEPRRLTDHPKSDTRGRASAPTAGARVPLDAASGASQVCVVEPRGGEPRKLTSLTTDAGGVPGSTRDAARDLRGVPRVRARTTACNKKKAGGGRQALAPRASTTSCSTATGTPGTTAGAATCCRCRSTAAPPRTSRPASATCPPSAWAAPTTTRSRPTASEVVLRAQRRARSRRSPPTPSSSWCRWRAERREDRRPAGYDGGPHTAPTAAPIAFRSQLRAGYESDRWRLMVYDRASGAARSLTEGFDRHVDPFAWSRRTRDALLHRRGRAAAPRLFACPPRAGRSSSVGARAPSATCRSAPDGRRWS